MLICGPWEFWVDFFRKLQRNYMKHPAWFGGEGMVYGFDLIDSDNRMVVHAFRFQVFYLPNEQTLLVTRGAHITAEGMSACQGPDGTTNHLFPLYRLSHQGKPCRLCRLCILCLLCK